MKYKSDTKELIAMKGHAESGGQVAELVSISTDGNYTLSSLYDLKNNLSMANDGEINFAFHSTSFCACNNVYYISEIVALDTDPIQTHLIEIDLDDLSIEQRVVRDYYYGLEIGE